MKLRLWPRRTGKEPLPEHAVPEAVESPPPVEPDPARPIEDPAAPPDELPAKLSLTLDEAKDAIRAAKGDVIQVGFLASEYRRLQNDDPRSAETKASRAHLCEVIAKRLRDRKVLAPDGVFELRDEASE